MMLLNEDWWSLSANVWLSSVNLTSHPSSPCNTSHLCDLLNDPQYLCHSWFNRKCATSWDILHAHTSIAQHNAISEITLQPLIVWKITEVCTWHLLPLHYFGGGKKKPRGNNFFTIQAGMPHTISDVDISI